jgi:hypothetical protein
MTQPTITNLLAKLDAMRGQKAFTKNRRGTQRANDFAIWRAGSSVNWECTSQEIANDTRISSSNVLNTCKRRGWKLVHNSLGGYENRHGIDTIIAHPRMMSGGAT